MFLQVLVENVQVADFIKSSRDHVSLPAEHQRTFREYVVDIEIRRKLP